MKWLQVFSKWFSSRPENNSEAESKKPPAEKGVRFSSERTRQPLPVGIRVSREKVHVQVGVDFGTSTTKVAYRQIGGRGQVKALNFDHGLPHYPGFCTPSLAAFDAKGNFLLGQ